MKKEKILIGWAQRDVTPDKQVSLRGQFHVRLSTGVRDPLTTTALAIEGADGGDQAIIASLDAVHISDYVLDGCRAKLRKSIPEFDGSKLIISATHTHTAPEQPGRKTLGGTPPLGDEVMTEDEYGELLVERITSASVDAWKGREPGVLAWGREHATIGFNRRVSYLDGSTVMYGDTAKDDFSHIEGHEASAVEMLFTYDSKQAVTGVLVNVPCPSQCTEGACFVSADFWHESRNEIRRVMGNDKLFILPQLSAAGDLSPRPMINRDADARMLALKGYGDDYNTARRNDIAAKLAGVVAEVAPLVAKDIRDEVEFAHSVLDFEAPRRIAVVEDLKIAESEVEEYKGKLAGLDAEGIDHLSTQYTATMRRIGFNQRVVDLYNAQQRGEDLILRLEVHVLRIGDVAMCTNRFEYYLDFGERIKARSKAVQTFIAQLAGVGGYLPPERSLNGGSYGAYIASTPVSPEGGQMIVEKVVAAINTMFE